MVERQFLILLQGELTPSKPTSNKEPQIASSSLPKKMGLGAPSIDFRNGKGYKEIVTEDVHPLRMHILIVIIFCLASEVNRKEVA